MRDSGRGPRPFQINKPRAARERGVQPSCGGTKFRGLRPAERSASMRQDWSNHSPMSASPISSCSMVIGGQRPTRIRRRRSTSYPSPVSARRRRKASSTSGASQSGHANLSSSLSATPRRRSRAVKTPSACHGVGMPSHRRVASKRKARRGVQHQVTFSRNGDTILPIVFRGGHSQNNASTRQRSDFERIRGPISSGRSHHTGVLIGR
jgi:hypothetical protein